MGLLLKIIKANYFQHIRSYSFLITLALSLYAAYAFIPSPDANYTTIRFGDFIGSYNSTWIGYVTALMTSVFLSLFGYFLVSGSIKRDTDLHLGQIIATTKIKNYKYLLAKTFSNFLVLLTMVIVIMLMSIVLQYLYGSEFDFNIKSFLLPYLVITLPSVFFIASTAVITEVFLSRVRIAQYLVFVFLFFCMLFIPEKKGSENIDLFGFKYTTMVMENQLNNQVQAKNTELSIGFIKKTNNDKIKLVNFEPIHFSDSFLMYRFSWILLGLGLVLFSSIFFHRFNVGSDKLIIDDPQESNTELKSARLQLAPWIQKKQTVFSIIPVLKVELIMLIRGGAKWLNTLSVFLMLGMIVSATDTGHKFLLPILWFLQVPRWSNLITKDTEYRTFYFIYSSYKPLDRIFAGRIIAGIFSAIMLASPLLIIAIITGNLTSFINIILGAVFIISLSTFMGVISQSSKLFEVSFLLITYFNINLISFTDYYGALHSSIYHVFIMTVVNLTLLSISYLLLKRRNL
ncbi:hypothetical protein [Aquimarina sp. 2201CG14-23]|uniref:hypothetical protein n=1 Tax=Aquimarina mycalae TaxID=3040073 RepID=UPI002477E3BE|nr:hypothetical protein [Aquimarina sp. 2201CG14-23]MDH7446096.1 hypothetical protein [Aquimarina sp. 2201CG14-23]